MIFVLPYRSPYKVPHLVLLDEIFVNFGRSIGIKGNLPWSFLRMYHVEENLNQFLLTFDDELVKVILCCRLLLYHGLKKKKFPIWKSKNKSVCIYRYIHIYTYTDTYILPLSDTILHCRIVHSALPVWCILV